MGGGKGGDFGETKGSFGISADDISNLLALMSIVPGLDIITNLLSIPVDLYRSDYFSALLDLVGVLPIAGEVGDAAKLGDKAVDASKAIKAADKAADAVKVTDKTVEAAIKAAKTKSISNNVSRVAKKYKIYNKGYFGIKGKNCQVYKCSDPIREATDFYKEISKGGGNRVLPNGKGVQTYFKDGSNVVFRVITSTPNSPAVQINITAPGKVKSQKIHFIKE